MSNPAGQSPQPQPGEFSVPETPQFMLPEFHEMAMQQLATSPGPVRHFMGRVVVGARTSPRETVAIIALGVGGLAFPPSWLLGVPFALTSKTWDLRDRWTGLAGPVFVVILGTAFAVMLGGQQSTIGAYFSEAWLAAGRISRGAAVLGALYLLWRLRRGPRPAQTAPWNRSHRLG